MGLEMAHTAVPPLKFLELLNTFKHGRGLGFSGLPLPASAATTQASEPGCMKDRCEGLPGTLPLDVLFESCSRYPLFVLM